MKIRTVIQELNHWAPLKYAESFDNTGLLTGEADVDVTGILVTLDCLEEVVQEAIEKDCNLIVAFHPIIFKGLNNLQPSNYVNRTIIKAIKHDIAIYAIHTALDVAHGGVSYRMAQALSLSHIKTLIPKRGIIKKLTTYVPISAQEEVTKAIHAVGGGELGNYSECSFTTTGKGTFKGNATSNPQLGKPLVKETVEEVQLNITYLDHLENKVLRALFDSHPYEQVSYEIHTLDNEYQNIGMGAIGELPSTLKTEAFLEMLKTTYGTDVVRHSLSRKRDIKKVAVLGGSGAFAINNALKSGADAYITADLKYHDFFNGKEMLLCDVGHYESEQFTKNLIQEYLSKKFSNFAVLCAETQTNPVNYY